MVVELGRVNFDVVTDMTNTLKRGDKGSFHKLPYDELPTRLTAVDLAGVSGAETRSAWRPLMVYIGGLTFDPDSPLTDLKIPNTVAATRIAQLYVTAIA